MGQHDTNANANTPNTGDGDRSIHSHDNNATTNHTNHINHSNTSASMMVSETKNVLCSALNAININNSSIDKTNQSFSKYSFFLNFSPSLKESYTHIENYFQSDYYACVVERNISVTAFAPSLLEIPVDQSKF
jgi:hypothetical protein